jgi:hypothetical protein
MTDEPVFGNDDLIRTLSQSLRRREHALKSAPGLLRRTLETGAWREFNTPDRERVTHERFADFVTAEPFAGLGITVDYVRRIVADHAETTKLLRDALKSQGSRTDLRNNVSDVATRQGNDRSYALDRLEREAPELHAEVVAGNLSAHAAMVKAGFRPKTFTVRADRPDSVARALRKNLTDEQITELRRLLAEGGSIS